MTNIFAYMLRILVGVQCSCIHENLEFPWKPEPVFLQTYVLVLKLSWKLGAFLGNLSLYPYKLTSSEVIMKNWSFPGNCPKETFIYL